jgi:hypothetical protein
MFISPQGEYPRHIGDIWLEHTNYKQGEELPKGWKEVKPTPLPELKGNQKAVEDFPVEVNGVMTQNWQVRDMTAEEMERRDAPKTAREKLIALGLTEAEVEALVRGLVR